MHQTAKSPAALKLSMSLTAVRTAAEIGGPTPGMLITESGAAEAV
jgi:hypothetical protein